MLFRDQPLVVVTSAEHYGAVLNPDFDYRKYLASLAAAGMNYTRIFTGSYVETPRAFGIQRNTLAPPGDRFLPPWARSGEAGYAGGGNKFDLDRWNPAYFERLRSFVALASREAILVEVTLFCSCYREEHWRSSPFHPASNVNRTTELADYKSLNTLDNGNLLARQEAMTRKIVRELNEYDNVIFEIQNEPWADRGVPVDCINPFLPPPARDRWPNAVEAGDRPSIEWQKRVADWIVSEESRLPAKHLIAQNYCNFRRPIPMDEIVPAASILNFHYAFPEAVTWNSGLGRVIGFDESGFAGSDDEPYRKQAWRYLLAGGGLFNSLDYSFTVGHEEGDDVEPNGPGGGSPALRRQLRVAREFIESLPFLEMQPDCGVVVRSPGVVAQAFSKPGEAYALYLAGNGEANLMLELPAGRYRADWVDTKTGAAPKSVEMDHAGGIAALRSPAFQVDIALKVVRRA